MKNNKKIKTQTDETIKLKQQINYLKETPVFSFLYFDITFAQSNKNDGEVYKRFVLRLHTLCNAGWEEIRKAHRHSIGTETLPIAQIKPQMATKTLEAMGKEKLLVFRVDGANHPFAGFILNEVFFVVFIETEFGTLYNH